MSKFTEISRFAVQMLGDAFAKELKELGDKYGVNVEYAGGRYGGVTGEVKLRIAVQATAGGLPANQVEFNRSCQWFGLQPGDFGKTFYVQGTAYRITGIKTSRPKFPISAERVYDRKGFKFPIQTVKQALSASAARSAA